MDNRTQARIDFEAFESNQGQNQEVRAAQDSYRKLMERGEGFEVAWHGFYRAGQNQISVNIKSGSGEKGSTRENGKAIKKVIGITSQVKGEGGEEARDAKNKLFDTFMEKGSNKKNEIKPKGLFVDVETERQMNRPPNWDDEMYVVNGVSEDGGNEKNVSSEKGKSMGSYLKMKIQLNSFGKGKVRNKELQTEGETHRELEKKMERKLGVTSDFKVPSSVELKFKGIFSLNQRSDYDSANEKKSKGKKSDQKKNNSMSKRVQLSVNSANEDEKKDQGIKRRVQQGEASISKIINRKTAKKTKPHEGQLIQDSASVLLDTAKFKDEKRRIKESIANKRGRNSSKKSHSRSSYHHPIEEKPSKSSFNSSLYNHIGPRYLLPRAEVVITEDDSKKVNPENRSHKSSSKPIIRK